MLKGYRRMSYLVLSQMESITAKRFKLLIRTERKWRIWEKKKYEKYLYKIQKNICFKYEMYLCEIKKNICLEYEKYLYEMIRPT